MNAPNHRDGLRMRGGTAKRQRQHRTNRRVQPHRRGPSPRAEMAVIHDPRRDQRVRHLHQDGTRPAEQDDAFGIDFLHGHRAILLDSTRVARRDPSILRQGGPYTRPTDLFAMITSIQFSAPLVLLAKLVEAEIAD